MSEFRNMVSAEWLLANLENSNVKVVDGSWYLPQQKRDPIAEFNKGHIPGAVFFDLDANSDTTSDLPHMMPDNATFAEAISTLGITNADHIVVYDGLGMMSAARIWWMLKAFGHNAVSILNGGLPAWKAQNGTLSSSDEKPTKTDFQANLDAKHVASWQKIAEVSANKSAQILDARSAERFAGQAPEPRAGLKGGHITGSFNLPFQKLLTADGKLRPTAQLREAFQTAGIDLAKPVATSCGSGVTAAILTLGLDELGHTDNVLYDGSWAEWGGRTETADLIET